MKFLAFGDIVEEEIIYSKMISVIPKNTVGYKLFLLHLCNVDVTLFYRQNSASDFMSKCFLHCYIKMSNVVLE